MIIVADIVIGAAAFFSSSLVKSFFPSTLARSRSPSGSGTFVFIGEKVLDDVKGLDAVNDEETVLFAK